MIRPTQKNGKTYLGKGRKAGIYIRDEWELCHPERYLFQALYVVRVIMVIRDAILFLKVQFVRLSSVWREDRVELAQFRGISTYFKGRVSTTLIPHN